MEKNIKGFKEGIFPLKPEDEFEEQQTSKKFNEKKLPINPTKLGGQEIEIIKEKEKNMHNDLFKKYCNYQSPSKMYKSLSDIKNTEKQ